MNSLTISSPAKVNLYLEVLGRRPDGYHELVTLFHRISLRDRLTLRKTSRPGFRLMCDHPKLRNQNQNLIFKAHQLLRRFAPWDGGLEVRLEKNVPIAAGLGGGSSNAAHFLLGVNRLFDLRLPRITLVRLSSQLGADVAFFLYDVNQSVGLGSGDRIVPIPASRKLWFVLVVPPHGLSTRRVYENLQVARLTRVSRFVTITSDFFGRTTKRKMTELSRRCRNGASLQKQYRNDLFHVSSLLRPELRRIDALFGDLGVRTRMMSGSGPAMMSIHTSKRQAQKVATKIRYRRPALKVFVCHTY